MIMIMIMIKNANRFYHLQLTMVNRAFSPATIHIVILAKGKNN